MAAGWLDIFVEKEDGTKCRLMRVFAEEFAVEANGLVNGPVEFSAIELFANSNTQDGAISIATAVESHLSFRDAGRWLCAPELRQEGLVIGMGDSPAPGYFLIQLRVWSPLCQALPGTPAAANVQLTKSADFPDRQIIIGEQAPGAPVQWCDRSDGKAKAVGPWGIDFKTNEFHKSRPSFDSWPLAMVTSDGTNVAPPNASFAFQSVHTADGTRLVPLLTLWGGASPRLEPLDFFPAGGNFWLAERPMLSSDLSTSASPTPAWDLTVDFTTDGATRGPLRGWNESVTEPYVRSLRLARGGAPATIVPWFVLVPEEASGHHWRANYSINGTLCQFRVLRFLGSTSSAQVSVELRGIIDRKNAPLRRTLLLEKVEDADVEFARKH
jgi:hypothetical protein